MDERESAYQERYCAYVDIIGFRGLINGLREAPSNFETLRSLLQKVHSRPRNTRPSDPEVRAQSISDAVALSTEVHPRGLELLFDALEALAIDLLCEGYFVRGAVVKGRLYHDEHMVFGEALVRAFEFESEQARYPRIVVLQEVREDMLHYSGQRLNPKMDRVRSSEDGPMYLDVLRPVIALGQKREHPYEKLTKAEEGQYRSYAGIRDKIQARYGASIDIPKHFGKVHWFAQYWNDVATRGTGFGRITGGAFDRR
jgi:hypothetical protein